MNVKKNLKINNGVMSSCIRKYRNYFFLFGFAILFYCCWSDAKKQDETYICPMECQKDPPVVFTQKVPGICPVCKMDLVTKTEFEKTKNDNTLNTLLKPTDAFVVASIKLIVPEERNMSAEYSATGEISYDTRTLTNIASRYNGRIEKLYVKYFFQPVKKGQKL